MVEPADLLIDPPMRAALARRDIAAVYRFLCAKGVSQTLIARATGQQQSDVSAILAGRRVQSIAVLERIADGLGVPRGWMGLAYAPGLGPRPANTAQTDQERSSNLLRHAATVLFGVPIFGPAGPIRAEAVPTPMPSRIGSGDVVWLAATTERLARLSNDLGGIRTSDSLTAHARTGEVLLRADMRESVRERLLIALADTHEAAGWAAGDAGLRGRARYHYARGMSFAGAADDKVRVLLNLRSEGRSELQFGEPNSALKLFQLGAGAAPTELTRAILEYDCAWALARMGIVNDALGALRRARDAQQRVADEPRPSDHFAITLPHVEGCTQLCLGRFDHAVYALTTAVQGAGHAVRCSTLNLSELATAQLRCGELQTAAQVVGKARMLRSVWVRDRLAPLQQAAAERRDSACRDLAHELAALRAAA